MSAEEAASRKRLTREEEALLGVQWNSTDGEYARAPQLPPRRASLLRPPPNLREVDAALRVLRGSTSLAEEDDAILDEAARSILASRAPGSGSASARANAASQLLSGDDSSDWGGDPLDLRFEQDPRLLARAWRRQNALPDADDPRAAALLRALHLCTKCGQCRVVASHRCTSPCRALKSSPYGPPLHCVQAKARILSRGLVRWAPSATAC